MSQVLSVLEQPPAFLFATYHGGSPQAFTFSREGKSSIRSLFTAPQEWGGMGSIVHGGFQALLLDDMMHRVTAELANGSVPVPRELTLRYYRSVRVNKPFSLHGYLVEDRGHEVEVCGEIKDKDGNLFTQAEGIFVRMDPGGAGIKPADGPANERRLDPGSLAQWPAWSACCRGPLERLWNLPVNWRLAPDRSALGGTLRLPSTLAPIPPAGILSALFDQTLGLLGNLQGDGVMLTIRLNVTLYEPLPLEQELVFIGQGQLIKGGPFRARAWLWHQNSLVAEANSSFSVLFSH